MCGLFLPNTETRPQQYQGFMGNHSHISAGVTKVRTKDDLPVCPCVYSPICLGSFLALQISHDVTEDLS